ncbi:LytR/AlgR family response regulator transcription factor [Pedobacter agri]|uniref:Response regulator n=1 Tax=Pedobacter agri TaxID=454586 RepID=A0A9X3DCL5_9SPHI|nr:response regulator [Pedobacter agri]MCX3264847.1 response regulator [Pedobacter agri]
MRNLARKYRCVIIDDELSSVELLKDYLSQIPKLELYKSYLNPALALKELMDGKKLDFLLLDINMQISGLDIAYALRNKFKSIIFITGNPRNALAAFGVEADEFIVKPVDFKKFLAVINRQIVKNLGSPMAKEDLQQK